MRVSNNGFTNSLRHTLSTQSARVGRMYDQLTSGQRLRQLSDDPPATVRALRAHSSLSELEARETVARQGVQIAAATDSALNDVANALSQVKNLCLQATSSTLDDAARVALADQVRSLQATLITAGNACVEGQYLFAGTKTDTPPLEASDTANLPVLYHGNHQQLQYQVGDGDRLPVGCTAAEVFNYPDASGTRPVAGVDRDVFSLLGSVADAMERGDVAQLNEQADQVEALHAHAVDLRGEVGIQEQRWQGVLDRASGTAVLLNQVVSDEESVDYTSAIVELSNLQTAYQAALGLTSQMLSWPTLFDSQ